jgi:dipeptidase
MAQVDAPVSVRKVMEIMGDTYAGTEFDQSKGLGAGPWGYPARFGGNTNLTGGWERPISMFRCCMTRDHRAVCLFSTANFL